VIEIVGNIVEHVVVGGEGTVQKLGPLIKISGHNPS